MMSSTERLSLAFQEINVHIMKQNSCFGARGLESESKKPI